MSEESRSGPVDQDKIKSLALGQKHKNHTKVTYERHEVDGKLAGYHTEHPDGHVDATVNVRTLDIKGRVLQPGGNSGLSD